MSIFDEQNFQNWYQKQAEKTGINPDPDDPAHFYDYRAAYRAGVKGPNEEGHWPSQFKREGNPRLYLNDIDTRTGKPRGGMNMQDFKPLPMKDIANPEPMHPAFEKTSQWMNSFMPTVMDKIRAGSVGPTNLGTGNQGGAGIADMLFQAVHPDTFNRVLDFLKPSQSRQFGGGVEPGEEYTVGEAGPEKFKPAVPGEIIPYGREPSSMGGVGPSSGRSITYAGMTDTRGPAPVGGHLEQPGWIGEQMRQLEGQPEQTPGAPGTFKESWAGQNLLAPIERFAESRRVAAGFPPTTGAWWNRGGTPSPLGLASGHEGGYPTGREHEGYGPPVEPGTPPPLDLAPGHEPWGDYMPEGQPTGIRYKMVGPENARGDELARQRILGEATPEVTGGGGYMPGSTLRGYYEAHPEEKAAQDYYDRMRGPAPDSYEAGVERMREMNLMDIVKSPNVTAEARKAATEQLTAMKSGRAERGITAMKGAGELWGKGMEYGPASPLSQERLAHARNLEMQPWMHMAGISEQNKAHLEGIRQQVEGHITAAGIAAHVKEPLMKEIGAALAMGQKNAQLTQEPFNFYKDIGAILKVAHALGPEHGGLTDEQYAKIPDEYKQTQTRRFYLKGVAYDIPEEKIAMMKSKYPDLKDKP